MVDVTATLAVDGDATEWITPPVDGFTLVRVALSPHDDFTGEIIFQTRVSSPAGDASDVAQVDVAAVSALIPAREYLVAIPRGFDFRVAVAEAVITLAESVAVHVTDYKVGGFGTSPRIATGPDVLVALTAEVAKVPVAVTDIGAVITDLEGDVAGNSVAQAITDLGAVVTALGA